MKPADRLRKYIDDNPEKVHAYFDNIRRLKTIWATHVDRCYGRIVHDTDGFVRRVLKSYDRDAYKDRWYGRSIEPPETLLWLLRDVAKKYGREFTPDEYHAHDGMFTQDVFVLGGYAFDLLIGQGAAVVVNEFPRVSGPKGASGQRCGKNAH